MTFKCESTSRRFQPGEGPSRGLLRDYEPSDGTFSSTSRLCREMEINGLKCTGLCSLLWEFLSWRREEEAEARGRTVALGGAGGGNRGVFRSQLHHQERKDAESTPSPSGTSKMVLVNHDCIQAMHIYYLLLLHIYLLFIRISESWCHKSG